MQPGAGPVRAFRVSGGTPVNAPRRSGWRRGGFGTVGASRSAAHDRVTRTGSHPGKPGRRTPGAAAYGAARPLGLGGRSAGVDLEGPGGPSFSCAAVRARTAAAGRKGRPPEARQHAARQARGAGDLSWPARSASAQPGHRTPRRPWAQATPRLPAPGSRLDCIIGSRSWRDQKPPLPDLRTAARIWNGSSATVIDRSTHSPRKAFQQVPGAKTGPSPSHVADDACEGRLPFYRF